MRVVAAVIMFVLALLSVSCRHQHNLVLPSTAAAFAFTTTTTLHRQTPIIRNSIKTLLAARGQERSCDEGDDDGNGNGDGNKEPNELRDWKKSPLGQNVRRAFLASSAIAGLQLLVSQTYAPSGFQRIPTQFLAVLADANANEGDAGEFGVWPRDPGPRGVWLDQYQKQLKQHNSIAPAGWRFSDNDWWVEEHGLIMEPPTFPLEAGRYLVTGGRQITTVLTVGEPKVDMNPSTSTSSSSSKQRQSQSQSWSLEDPKATLYDVTHLPCRSARYTQPTGTTVSSSSDADADAYPSTTRLQLLPPNEAANMSDFPVPPGATMPQMKGYIKQDYAVLFVIGKEEKQTA
jgi:hypothetical protein